MSELDLLKLQNLVKRDKESYKHEFIVQYNHYKSLRELFVLNPNLHSKEFQNLVNFISHTSHLFPLETGDFSNDLILILQENSENMNIIIRQDIIKALILLKNRKIVDLKDILPVLFINLKFKNLRNAITDFIIADLKKNSKNSKEIQDFLFKKITQPQELSEILQKKSLDILISTYKKGIWKTEKTVNVLGFGVFSQVQKVVSTSLSFFLKNETVQEDELEDNLPDLSKLKHSNSCNKKSKSRKNQLEKLKNEIKRKENRKLKENSDFSALYLINDPQGWTEKLFSRFRQVHSSNEFRFEIRILYLNLISRMIGVHKLFVLQFYDFMIPYMKPQQKEITSLLAFVAQASHELVPPDALETVVQAIADNFVWSNCAAEVVTAGLNALREICSRCPLAMPESLLQSLMEDYKNHREKGPMNAARSLLGLYREVNPELLKKKDRGKTASMNMKSFIPPKYGETRVSKGVEGAELLLLDDEAPLLVQDSEEEVLDDDEFDLEVEAESDEETTEEASSDEGEEENEETSAIAVVAVKDGDEHLAKRQKLDISASKILTDEDFQRIRELKFEREAERMSGLKNSKVTVDTSDNEDAEIVDVSKITSGIRRKDDYAARVEKIKAGREGRSFGSKKGSTERTSVTNKVKSKKNKAFMMMVHKKDVKNKAKRSLREKQVDFIH